MTTFRAVGASRCSHSHIPFTKCIHIILSNNDHQYYYIKKSLIIFSPKSLLLTCQVPMLSCPSVIGILTIYKCQWKWNWWTHTKKKKLIYNIHPYVRAHPNIDDLMCAGISSGPALHINKLHVSKTKKHAHHMIHESWI